MLESQLSGEEGSQARTCAGGLDLGSQVGRQSFRLVCHPVTQSEGNGLGILCACRHGACGLTGVRVRDVLEGEPLREYIVGKE